MNSPLRSVAAIGLGAFFVAAVIGCSGSKYDASVSGKVTIDGEPVGPGEIIFASSNRTAQPPTGKIDAYGNYSLTTGGEAGLVPASYAVSVKAYKVQAGAGPGVRLATPSEPQFPPKYLSAKTSGLEYDVAPGSNTINIELTSE